MAARVARRKCSLSLHIGVLVMDEHADFGSARVASELGLSTRTLRRLDEEQLPFTGLHVGVWSCAVERVAARSLKRRVPPEGEPRVPSEQTACA